jgi:hypothetical protein
MVKPKTIIVMSNTEQQIWDLVNDWCNEQSCEIPDFNRRALMDRISSLNGGINQISMHDLTMYYLNHKKFDFTSKAIDVLNDMASHQQNKRNQ